MQLTVASGKGGTGKTTIAVGLALVAGKARLMDCDVEEPNAHLYLQPELDSCDDIYIKIPAVDSDKCTLCGKCSEICQYNALARMGEKLLFFKELCHGCGACSLICPEGAISELDNKIGVVESGRKGEVAFVHGMLQVGEPMATPIIRAVKAKQGDEPLTIVDSAPGTACPMVAAISESEFCLLVTEPTPFGLSDLKLAVEVVEKLSIPRGVAINRSSERDDAVIQYCEERGLPLLGRIPFDRKVAEAYARGIHPVNAVPAFKAQMEELLEKTKQAMDKQS